MTNDHDSSGRITRSDLRNIAVIAHVDHGKTTLVDGLLKQSMVFRDAEAAGTLIMDSNELERERGITAEGPLPQTRFVLGLALSLGLRPLVVVNKVDRKDARAAEVVEEIADLFLELASDDAQLSYPVIYAIAREGRAGPSPLDLAPDLGPLFRAIVEHVPAPVANLDGPVQVLVSALDYDPHRGRIAIGRVIRGTLAKGMSVRVPLATASSWPVAVNFTSRSCSRRFGARGWSSRRAAQRSSCVGLSAALRSRSKRSW